MTNRRQFLKIAGATSLLATSPHAALAERFQHLPTRVIPGTDEHLPVIGLGNSAAFRSPEDGSAERVLQTYANYGGSYVDCGGASRLVVAETCRAMGVSDDMFLGMYFSGADESRSRTEAKQLMSASGKAILDLMHSTPEDAAPHWDTFQAWKDDGLTKYIGMARHRKVAYPQMIRSMQTGTVDFLQVNYSLLETESEKRVLPMARDKGVAVTINRPFINGRYFGIVKGHTLPDWAAEFQCETWAQFSLKFILSHPAVNCVLTETSNPKHAVDNIGAGFGELPNEKTRQRMLKLIRTMV